MKKILFAWMLLLSLGSTLWIEQATAQNSFFFSIRSNNDWNRFRDAVQRSRGQYWVDASLEADITTDGGIGIYEDTPYRGTFNGNGHTVTVDIRRGDGRPCALFCYAGDCTIRDLHVRGNISGGNHSAGLIGAAQGGTPTFTIDRVWVSTGVDVAGSHGGGIVGHSRYARVKMTDCRFDGTINTNNNPGNSYAGCIIGWCDGGSWSLNRVYNCPSAMPVAWRIYFCVDYNPSNGAITPWGMNDKSSLTITSTPWADWRVAHYGKTDQNEVVNLMNGGQADSWVFRGGLALPKKFESSDVGDQRALPGERWQLLEWGSSSGKLLESGRYYVTRDITFSNSSTGSGLTIASGAVVYIHVPKGVTLTAKGGDASGQSGAGAGILLPAGSTLYLEGDGKVVATGGNAANGGDGKQGSNAGHRGDNGYWGGNGGAGGDGGGGAGAGIGTGGGDGGAGGSAAGTPEVKADAYGVTGNSGASGQSALAMGNLYVGIDLKLDANGGSKGASGKRGSQGKNGFFHNPGKYNYSCAGGGGGGAGGYGGAASGVGTGGPGGGGGGSGSGGSVGENYHQFYRAESRGGEGGLNADGSEASEGVGAFLRSVADAEIKEPIIDGVPLGNKSFDDEEWCKGKAWYKDGGSRGGCGAASRESDLNYKYLLDFQVHKSKDGPNERVIRAGYRSTESRSQITILIPSAYSMGLTKQGQYLSQWNSKSNFTSSWATAGDTYIIRQGENTLYAHWKDYKDIFPKGFGSKTDPFIIEDGLLLELADYVNKGGNTRNVYFKQKDDILLSNILTTNHRGSQWTPIGYNLPFEGDYDGGGFCIRNGEIGSKAGNKNLPAVGIFGKVLGSIHNVGVESITVPWPIDDDARCGTLAGVLMRENGIQMAGQIRDCYVVKSHITAHYGGVFLGAMEANTSISYCHEIDNALQGGHAASFSSIISSNAKVDRCFTGGTSFSADGYNKATDSRTRVSSSQMASGEITWLLNGQSPIGNAWHQDINVEGGHRDAHPVLNAESAQVYSDGSTYSNKVIGPLTAFTGKGTAEEPFLIQSITDLKHLSNYCNNGGHKNAGIHFRQTADIDLNGSSLIPIANANEYVFEGIYDGDGHTIRNGKIDANVFVGIFGRVTGTVTRLVVEKMTIKNNSDVTARVGVIAGRLHGNGVISNCLVKNCRVTGDKNAGVAGGIVADMYDNAIVRNCLACNDTVSAHSMGYVCAEMVHAGTTLMRCYTDGNKLVDSSRDWGTVSDSYPGQNKNKLEDGSVAFGLNGGVDNPDPAWFQNIDLGSKVDSIPVLHSDHARVYKIDGVYTNDGEQLSKLGEGTAENPYKIGSPEDLKKLIISIGQMRRSNFHVLQTADIDLRDSLMVPIGTGTAGFEGHYDGGGYVVKNINMQNYKNEGMGLFNNILGTVERLGIENGTFKADGAATRVGAIAGKLSGEGVLRNCFVKETTVDFNNMPGVVVGALVGEQTGSSRIESCYGYKNTVAGRNDGQNHYGHIVGYISGDAAISHAYTDGPSLCADRQSGAGKITGSEAGVSDFRFNSGALCYQLNGSRDNGTTWRQKLLADQAPVTNPGQPSVFRHTLDEQTMYTNTNDVPYSVRLTLDPNHDGNQGKNYEVFMGDDRLFVPPFKLAPHAEDRLYYEFIGWNTQPDGKGEYYAADGEVTPKQAMTLYAVWGLTVPAENDDGKGRVVPLDANTVYYKIYDEGGHSSFYGYDYKGKLTLSAPRNHFILLGGTVATEAAGSDGKPRDYVMVYDGDYTRTTKLANEKGDTVFFSKVNGDKTDIGKMMSSGNEMTIEFVTDDINCFDGLDLTVAVLPNALLNLGGTGSKEKPFLVGSLSDLMTVDRYINTTGDSKIYIRQVADIDMDDEDFTPLASGVKSFEGHYDGGGHVIRNGHIKAPIFAGLFSVVSGTVTRLGMENMTVNYEKIDGRSGAIAARLSGNSEISYCYVKGCTVTNNGIQGYEGQGVSGAIVSDMFDQAVIKNCYSYQNKVAATRAAHICSDTKDGTQISQCYTDGNNLYCEEGATITASEAGVAAERFASGEVCFRLNGGKTSDVLWRQTLGTDNVPGFSNTQGVVYTYQLNDKPAYSNTAISRPQYYISNAEEFRRFMGQEVEQEGDIYLTQDIDLGSWEGVVVLKGNFDGGGHTITYNQRFGMGGFFRHVASGASLKHLRLDGTIKIIHGIGGMVLFNDGTISDCHFKGNINYYETASSKGTLHEFALVAPFNRGVIDHCSTTCNSSFATNKNVRIWPISTTEDGVSNCTWIDPVDRSKYNELWALAEQASAEYPVYAQGIIDAVDVELCVGDRSIIAQNGHLYNLEIDDDKSFKCPSGITVDEIIYKRKGTNGAFEPWVLPFAYTIDDRMNTEGVEFYRLEKDGSGDLLRKLIERGTTYQVAANEPLAFRTTTPANTGYRFQMRLVKHGVQQPLTIQMPTGDVAMTISSTKDDAHLKASYEGIPADMMTKDVKYVWNNAAGRFALGDGQKALSPFRFYLQYADKATGNIEPWEQTDWARRERRAQAQQQSAPRRASRRTDFAKLTAEGWQPVVFDFDNVTVTEERLNDYEILALSDICDTATKLDGDDRSYAATAIYEQVEAGTELLVAHPLLVRAKRADVAPLSLDELGSEINELFIWAVENNQEDKVMDFIYDNHIWCSTVAGRYDVWQMPMPERNSVLSEAGALIFNATGSEPCFYRVGADDGVFMRPMSYCFTAYDEQTYENLPLDGDRINVVVLGYTAPGDDVTGINDVNADKAAADGNGDGDSYNLQGQKVGDSYRGIVVKNGRKMLKR